MTAIGVPHHESPGHIEDGWGLDDQGHFGSMNIDAWGAFNMSHHSSPGGVEGG